MPNTQIALIRGINVGRAKRVAMAELRALFEELGYADVRTLLNSGNVVFTAPRATAGDAVRIEQALADRLHVSARVLVISAVQLNRIVAENPLLSVAHDASRLLIAFLARPTDRKKLEAVRRQDWENEALALGDGVAYIWCAAGILESRLLVAVSRVLGDGMTTRNWATVTKLHALAAQPPPMRQSQ